MIEVLKFGIVIGLNICFQARARKLRSNESIKNWPTFAPNSKVIFVDFVCYEYH